MERIFRTLFNHSLNEVYFANIFLSFHAFLIIYINSPFLEQFISGKKLGLLFGIGSLVNILVMMVAPKILDRSGIKIFALSVIALEAIGIVGMMSATHPLTVSTFFVLHQVMILLIYYVLDLYLEHATKSETFTGRIRSVFLTGGNVVLVISPLIAGAIVGGTGSFLPVYALSAFFLLPLFFTVATKLPHTGIGNTLLKNREHAFEIARAWKNSSIRSIIFCRFILEFFAAWMVIYMALHLSTNIGFSWPTIGTMFSIMLLPFVIFELPLGIISDRYRAEKKILLSGFAIAALATAIIPHVEQAYFIGWTALLFFTRVGASFIEISTESFFFKHVGARDTGTVSLFRLARPLALIIAPGVASVSFFVLSLGQSFFILAFVLALGIVAAATLPSPHTPELESIKN